MRLIFPLLLIPFLFAVGCSDNKVEKHVLQEKVDTIEKAKEVEQLIQNTFEQQKQTIDEQSH
ncbi:MAG: hypothetical protein KAU29_11260 [Gammaproteobacteria bacterium]|nr:hypothetical protein [Gammaproteobacteria bacterium]